MLIKKRGGYMRKTHATYHDEDILGKKFYKLLPISKVEGTRTKWHCVCDCGNTKDTYAWKLIQGKVKSCGCYEKENLNVISRHNNKHGMAETILYKKWCSMKARCFNPHYKYYKRYGGRGITVCPEWLGEHGFEHFAEWAYNNGYDDSKTKYEQSIDRINTDGNYSPENCKWSNQLEQVKNRSNSFLITDIDGEELTHVQFSKKHGIDSKNLFVYRRMKKGLSAIDILKEWEDYERVNDGNYLKVSEFAQKHGVAKETVKLWINKKEITAYQVRKVWYIPKEQERPN